MTDKYDSLYKWTIPVGTLLESNSYLTIWLDKDEEQGDFHANFKLASAGEALYLSNANQELVDELLFFSQSTDISYGRYPNGTGDFDFLTPSFAANNMLLSLADIQLDVFKFYPNPVSTTLFIESTEAQLISIYSLRGDLVLQEHVEKSDTVDISGLVAGMYFVSNANGLIRKLIISDL